MERLKKYIILLIIILCSAFTFAELPQAPNTVITENPDKEVTTVEAPKNREHAEMNITVNKLIPKEIEGIELPTGEVLLFIDKEEGMIQDRKRRKNIFYVTDSIDNFPDLSTVNGKTTIANIQKMKDKVASNGIVVNEYDGLVVVEDGQKHPELFVGIVDKLSGETSKVWEIKRKKAAKLEEIVGRIKESKIAFSIPSGSKIAKELKGDDLILFPTKLLFTPRSKRSLGESIPKIEKEYKEKIDKEAAGSEMDTMILSFSGSRPTTTFGYNRESRNVYRFIAGTEIRGIKDNVLVNKFDEAIVTEMNGTKYLWLGNALRYNRAKSHSESEDGSGYYNFSIQDSGKWGYFDVVNTDYATVERQFWMQLNPFKKEMIIYGGEGGGRPPGAMSSSHVYSEHIAGINAEVGVTLPPQLEEIESGLYGWVLAYRIMFEINDADWNKVRRGEYVRIRNKKDINVQYRLWNPTPDFDNYVTATLIQTGALDSRLVTEGKEVIDLTNKFPEESVQSNYINNDINKSIFQSPKWNWEFDVNSENRWGEMRGRRHEVSPGELVLHIEERAAYGSLYMGIFFKTLKNDRYDETHIVTTRQNTHQDRLPVSRMEYTVKIPWYEKNPLNATVNVKNPVYDKVGIQETSSGIKLIRSDNIGGTYDFGNASGRFWEINKKNIGNRLRFGGDNPSKSSDDNVSPGIGYWSGPTFGNDNTKLHLTFDDNPVIGAKNLALLEIKDWDLEAKTINVQYESVHYTQNIKVNIEAFKGDAYIRKSGTDIDQNINFADKSVNLNNTGIETGEIGRFTIETGNYNWRIFKKDGSSSQFALRIPKQVTLYQLGQPITVYTEVADLFNRSYKRDEGGYWYFHPTQFNGNYTAIKLQVKLKLQKNTRGLEKSDFGKFTGSNLGLVQVGVRGSNKAFETIIDKVNASVPVTDITESIILTGKGDSPSENYKDSEAQFIPLSANHKVKISVEGGQTTEFTGDKITNQQYMDIPGTNYKIAQLLVGIPGADASKPEYGKLRVRRKGPVITGINKKVTIEATYKGVMVGKFTIANLVDKAIGNATVNLKNPLIKSEWYSGYGRIKVYPTSKDNKNAMFSYLLQEDALAPTNIKNNQFSFASGTGGTIAPFIHGENKQIIINDSQQILLLPGSNPLPTTQLKSGIPSGIKLGINYQETSKSKYGVDFVLDSWDLAKKDFSVKIEGDTFINTINFNIPAFDGSAYYHYKTEGVATIGTIDYGAKKVSNSPNEFLGGELARFTVGTKDYDLRILGNNGGVNNLRMEIPKTIPVKFESNGITIEGNLSVMVQRKGNITNVREENGKYIVRLIKDIDGVTSSLEPTEVSNMLAEVSILWDSSRNILSNINPQNISIIGDKLGLVKIGVPEKMDWTILDKVEFKIENQNYDLKFDIKEINAPENEIVPTPNPTIEFNLNNKIEIYDKVTNSVVYKGTGESLQNIGWKNEEFGATLKYSNINDGFVVDKFKNIDYDKNFIMYIKSINGVALRTINLHLINSDGFEIIDGHGKLDFGDFFPGDIKQAGDTIRFKNIHNAKINIEMKTPTTEMSKLGVSNPTADQKIQVRKLEAYDLNTQNKNENHFKIKGEAVTTPTTEVGKYKGTAEVIITIIP